MSVCQTPFPFLILHMGYDKPTLAQTRRQNVTAEQWQHFREEHGPWAHRYEPDAVLPLEAWSEAIMEILVRAVGPPACRTRVRVEAQEWGMLIVHKW